MKNDESMMTLKICQHIKTGMVNHIDTENKISTFMKYVVIRNIENKVLSVCKTQSRAI